MTAVIVYTRPDGGVSVVRPAYGDKLRPKDDSDAALLARCMARLPADAINAQIVDDSAIPADRTFRNAWAADLSVDMTKARAIQMERIRAARNAKLAALDPLWMRATGRGDTVTAAAVEAEREVLRNIPQTFDLTRAADADALKELWPAELADAKPARVRA